MTWASNPNALCSRCSVGLLKTSQVVQAVARARMRLGLSLAAILCLHPQGTPRTRGQAATRASQVLGQCGNPLLRVRILVLVDLLTVPASDLGQSPIATAKDRELESSPGNGRVPSSRRNVGQRQVARIRRLHAVRLLPRRADAWRIRRRS